MAEGGLAVEIANHLEFNVIGQQAQFVPVLLWLMLSDYDTPLIKKNSLFWERM